MARLDKTNVDCVIPIRSCFVMVMLPVLRVWFLTIIEVKYWLCIVSTAAMALPGASDTAHRSQRRADRLRADRLVRVPQCPWAVLGQLLSFSAISYVRYAVPLP